MIPVTNPRSAPKSSFPFQLRRKQAKTAASANTGISQSVEWASRARSTPESESFAAPQLTCTQGRKKQITTITAALRLTFLRLSIPWHYRLTLSVGPGGLPICNCRFWVNNRSTKPHEPNHSNQHENLSGGISCHFVDRLVWWRERAQPSKCKCRDL